MPSMPMSPQDMALMQSNANIGDAYTQATLNQANTVTPTGSTTWSNIGPQVEEAGQFYGVGQKTFSDLGAAQAYKASGGGDVLKSFGGGYKVGNEYFASKADADAYAQKNARFEQTVTLTPEQQAIFDTKERISQSLADLAEGRAGQITTDAFDISDIAQVQGDDVARQRVEQALYDRMSALYEPEFAQAKEQLTARLAQQGIPVGSQAWQDAMGQLEKSQNLQRQQTVGESVAMGETAFANQYARDAAQRSNAINERLMVRNQPMNELASFLGGSPQMQTPQLQSAPQVQMQPTDVTTPVMANYQAQMNNYNQQMNNRNSTIGGLTSLAGTIGTGLMAFNPFGWGAGAATGAGTSSSGLMMGGFFG